jgi:hypothetical protein
MLLWNGSWGVVKGRKEKTQEWRSRVGEEPTPAEVVRQGHRPRSSSSKPGYATFACCAGFHGLGRTDIGGVQADVDRGPRIEVADPAGVGTRSTRGGPAAAGSVTTRDPR